MKDYNLIIEIIENDIKEGNIEDLKVLKKYLDNELLRIQNQTHNSILNESLVSFLDKNIKGDRMFKRNRLCIAFANLCEKEDILVLDTIGIKKEDLKQCRNLTSYTIERYERLLNEYGFSLEIENLEKTENMTETPTISR